ncbi:MAG: molybdenum cofactor biosynthesis protein MoaE [Alphaproteobacteria bacterium]|jgi:molybdopterin synthase catalytic subunit|nr:molybdenum cofactor biosynthesis protein MoaE [Alphaproteobacteria bacterium]|tara:strand:+ start:607 stop:1023 length:417 start_codon:yes stop_codon:yes gene_type:complete
MIKIRIQSDAFNIENEIKEISRSKLNGATVSFIGSVRDLKSENLKNLEIEHFPKMAEKVLEKTAQYAFKNWNLSQCIIIHRYGKLKIADPIVLIITSSPHRKEAFKANEYIIDFLKTNAPFWKKENTEKRSYWVNQKN